MDHFIERIPSIFYQNSHTKLTFTANVFIELEIYLNEANCCDAMIYARLPMDRSKCSFQFHEMFTIVNGIICICIFYALPNFEPE